MSATDNFSTLPSLFPDVLQVEIPPLQESWLFREYVWRSSWLERLAMIVVPSVLLLVFVQTTGQFRTTFRECHDDQFYGSDPRHSTDIFLLSGYKLFGWSVSEPWPLISHQELIKQTRKDSPQAWGLYHSYPGEWLYPQSLIPQAGLHPTEIYVYVVLIGGLLILWTILALWNLGSFAMQRRRIHRYARLGLVPSSEAIDLNPA